MNETSSIKTEENNFVGKYDTKIFWKKWMPEGESRATLLIVHGLNEYSERYRHVINSVVPNGIAVYALDHRGHGRSEGQRAYVNKFIDFIEDLRKFFIDIVQKESEGKPVIILGHSMGSVITMNYVRMHPEGLSGMVISGSGTTSTTSPILRFGASILSVLAPKKGISLPFPEGWITRDENEVKNYDEDPYCGYITSFRLGAEINKWLKKAKKGLEEIKIPSLIQIGKEDIAFKGKEELYEKLGSENKTLKIYEGCRHEVYNEIIEDRKKILADLNNWIDNLVAQEM